VDHVLIRPLEHLSGSSTAPALAFGVETRERPGPLYKQGAFEDDAVWVQVNGGLFVSRAVVRISWVGEYSNVAEVRRRTHGAALSEDEAFWRGRPRAGYAGVVTLQRERWLDQPFWAGPRTYGYEWVVLENEAKEASWLDRKPPPRGGEGLLDRFLAWRSAR
jgi:hypothetical protein